MIYLDSSAIVKLIKPEAESPGLRGLAQRTGRAPVTSVLAEVEVPRALRRSGLRPPGRHAGVLARIVRIEIDASVRATAGAYFVDALRHSAPFTWPRRRSWSPPARR